MDTATQGGAPIKIIVAGGRDWTDWAAVYRALLPFPVGTVLVQGGCRRKPFESADRIAQHIGRALGFEVVTMEAEWGKYGLGAGPIRNSAMVKAHQDAQAAITFGGRTGTADFTRKAVRAGIPVFFGGSAGQ